MRSVSRRQQKDLSVAHFGQTPGENHAVLRGVRMQPTLGFEIVMMRQSRSLSHAFNFKRKMMVGLPKRRRREKKKVLESRKGDFFYNLFFFLFRILAIRWLLSDYSGVSGA